MGFPSVTGHVTSWILPGRRMEPRRSSVRLNINSSRYICHFYYSRSWYFFHSQMAVPVSSGIWLRNNNLETKRGRVLPGTVRLWTRILTIPFRCWQKGKGGGRNLTGSWDLLLLKPRPHSSAQAIAPPAWGVLSFLLCRCFDTFLQFFCRFPGLGHLRWAWHARRNT